MRLLAEQKPTPIQSTKPPCSKSEYLRTTRNILKSLSGIFRTMPRNVLRTVIQEVAQSQGTVGARAIDESSESEDREDVKTPRRARV